MTGLKGTTVKDAIDQAKGAARSGSTAWQVRRDRGVRYAIWGVFPRNAPKTALFQRILQEKRAEVSEKGQDWPAPGGN
jgi:hypothetical protein